MTTVLVTGATGFLGRHVLSVLTSRWPDAKLVGLSRSPTGLPEHVTPIAGSVEDPSTWAGHPALAELDVIVHTAALVSHSQSDAEQLARVNVDGTMAMVDLAADRAARLIFMSTSGTVGVFRDADSWADEHSPYAWKKVKNWPYYASKITAEKRARKRSEDHGVSLSILRPPVLLGPDDPTGRSVKHVSRILKGHLPALVKGGMHWVDIRHVAEAVVTIAGLEQPRPVYNLPGTQDSLRGFADRVAAIGGGSTPALTVPWRAASRVSRAFGKRTPLPDPVLIEMAGHWWGLRTRFADEIGWAPPEGDVPIRDTITWLQEKGSA